MMLDLGLSIEDITPDGLPRVIGLDLSLSSTGIASNIGWTDRIQVKAQPNDPGQFNRLRRIRDRVLEFVNQDTALVVVEGLAFGSGTAGHHTITGLWHLVMEAVDSRCIPWAEVPPATLKKYATGKGNAAKDEVLAAVLRRWPDIVIGGNDEADALALAAMGADHLGHPMTAMPAANRTSLDKVRWPS